MTPELQKQIEQEAKAGQHTYPGTDYGHGFNKGYDSGYKFAAEKYADLWQAAERRAERAEKALKEFARQIKMHCNKMGIRSVVIQCIANRMEELDITEALTHKTSTDENAQRTDCR